LYYVKHSCVSNLDGFPKGNDGDDCVQRQFLGDSHLRTCAFCGELKLYIRKSFCIVLYRCLSVSDQFLVHRL